MATSKLIEAHRNGAEIFNGIICKEKIEKLLDEFSIPKGLMPLDEIEEFGFNRSNGFFWLRNKKKKEHRFKSIRSTVVYDVEITCFVAERHLTKLTGVKAKQLMVPVVICDISVGVPCADKVKFTTPVGLSNAYAISAFEDDQEDLKMAPN